MALSTKTLANKPNKGRRRFVDLSIAIESGLPSDPPVTIPKIDYVDHNRGREQMKDFFPGITSGDLPGGLGWAVEFLTLDYPFRDPSRRSVSLQPDHGPGQTFYDG